MNLCEDAAMRPAARGFEATPHISRQCFNAVGTRGPQSFDPEPRKITLIVEGSGVAEVTRRAELDRKAQTLSIGKDPHLARRLFSIGHSGFGRIAFAINRQS